MQASEFNRKRTRIERRAGNRAAFLRKAMAHLLQDAGAVEIVTRGQVVGWRMRDGKTVCAKYRYRDEAAASVDLARITTVTGGRGHIPVRVYFCSHCSGWHLTSRQ